MHFDGREADDHDVDGVAEQVLAAALAALGPVVIGTAKLVLSEIAAQITLNKLVRTESGSAAWDV